ncbi:hypothetical protein FAK_34720 [Desulfoferula mesophila]|uniref:Uncharacterized protein n=1 Tax=Desulfoferula mesophila TaxID=3058419 RepID=A0AAU9ERE0_9BACT|nr:hypothetical protein FAK_34720 [Desulfoferula mesophilus]
MRGGFLGVAEFREERLRQAGEKTGKGRPALEAGPMDDMRAKDRVRIALSRALGKPQFRAVR